MLLVLCYNAGSCCFLWCQLPEQDVLIFKPNYECMSYTEYNYHVIHFCKPGRSWIWHVSTSLSVWPLLKYDVASAIYNYYNSSHADGSLVHGVWILSRVFFLWQSNVTLAGFCKRPLHVHVCVCVYSSARVRMCLTILWSIL